MPFIPDARHATGIACNRQHDHEGEDESVRCETSMSLRASNDGAARAGGRIQSAAIRIPLNEWPMSEKMHHVAEWLAANFTDRVRMRQAAALVAMSERSLLRNFTREIGVTPSVYLTRVRLARACTMLERTALPVDSIARRCGLGSGDYLSHLFRRHFDRTPTEYRQSHVRVGAHTERAHSGEALHPLFLDGDSGR